MKPFPANAYIGEDGNVYSLDTGDNLGPASGFAPKTPPTAPGRIERAAGDGTTLTAGDIRREQMLNAKESGIAATIGALGSAAQMGLNAIPTAMDTRNREQLSKLRTMEAQNRMGLDPEDRRMLENELLTPVRALATEARQRGEDRAVSAGNQSAGAQRAIMRDADRVAAEAAGRAGIEIARQNADARARNRQELEERISYEGQEKQKTLSGIGNVIGNLANTGGQVLAAQATERPFRDEEINIMRQSGDYPDLANMSNEEFRKKQAEAKRAASPIGKVFGALRSPTVSE